jgi:hypothetical protein
MKILITALILAAGCSSMKREEDLTRDKGPAHGAEAVLDAEPADPSSQPRPSAAQDAGKPAQTCYWDLDGNRSCGTPCAGRPPTDTPGWAGIYDAANDCFRPAMLGCFALSGITADLACFKRVEDGVVVRTSSTIGYALGQDWRRCTKEDAVDLAAAACPGD